MKEATAKKILKSVSNSYNIIANEFSDTRQYSWEEFKYFKPYLFEGAEIVDLGCGNGRLIKFLDQYFLGQKYNYVGIDNSSGLLSHANKAHPQKVFLPGDQLSLPLADNQADIIFNIAAFHHIPSTSLRLESLYEMSRILKPNGLLVITVWNLWQWKYWKANLFAWLRALITFGDFAINDLFISWKNPSGKTASNRYYHSFLPTEINHLVKKAGFTIIENFAVKKGQKVAFLKSFNYIIIARNNG